jgi:hypothetical protein
MHADRTVRTASPADYDPITAMVDLWWGHPMAAALQRVFLDHFWPTSLVADRASEEYAPGVAGFLVASARRRTPRAHTSTWSASLPPNGAAEWAGSCTSGSSS